MSISSKVGALLSLKNMKQQDLMGPLDMSTKQTLSNKFVNDRWSGKDLIAVADATGCKLSFVFPDGSHIDLN